MAVSSTSSCFFQVGKTPSRGKPPAVLLCPWPSLWLVRYLVMYKCGLIALALCPGESPG